MIWLPGEPPPRFAIPDLPLGLWRTWSIFTVLLVVLTWLPIHSSPAAGLRLFTPITPASFGSVKGMLSIPACLTAIYAGGVFGQKIKSGHLGSGRPFARGSLALWGFS